FAVPLWHDGASFVSLAVPQVIGVGVIAIWTFVATAVVFGGFRALGQVRVSSDHEREGLDTAEHGVDTYPEFGSPDHDTGIRTDGSGVPSGDGFMTTGRED
ncbi:ammonium transporter, partial [Haloferax volcanii]